MRVLQLQTKVFEDKAENIRQVSLLMDEQLKERSVDMVTLGEMFNCPYETKNFPLYAELEGGENWELLSDLARRHGVYLSAGSVPERDKAGRIYNTAYVFDRDGRQIAKHRKMHLFDIDVKGGQRFMESETLTSGQECTVFDTEFGKLGLCICFDIRFPELTRLMVLKGARAILVPAAFNMTTGPAHWSIHFQGRALDNQCFMIGTSVARDMTATYHAWGHSIITSPWGRIVSEADESECCMYSDIDLDEVDKVRRELPLLSARRTDLYELREL